MGGQGWPFTPSINYLLQQIDLQQTMAALVCGPTVLEVEAGRHLSPGTQNQPGNIASSFFWGGGGKEVQRVLGTEFMASLRLSKGCSTLSLSFLLSSQETGFGAGTGVGVSVEGPPTV